MRNIAMTSRFIAIATATALAAGLAACTSAPSSSRLASAQSTPTTAPFAVVHSLADCPASDFSRNFGATTPWSENPYLNPCWPN
jgi:hypothetical protein